MSTASWTGQPSAAGAPSAFLDDVRRSVASGEALRARAVEAMREAGYHRGRALFGEFATWLARAGQAEPARVADDQFPPLLDAFFRGTGWGQVTLEPLGASLLQLDTVDWAETGAEPGGCLITTGLLAGFLGAYAEAPLSVLEVDPGAPGAGRGRFLVGSLDVLDHVWDAMQQGVPYGQAALDA